MLLHVLFRERIFISIVNAVVESTIDFILTGPPFRTFDNWSVKWNDLFPNRPSVYVNYLYDSAGQRVKKLSRKQGGQHYTTTIYIDDILEYHRIVHGDKIEENNTLHVMDDKKRIVMIRIGTAFSDDQTPPVKYQVGDHLKSSSVVMDDSGNWINTEEYIPYSETSFGSFSKKSYRFAGKEKDEYSGLYYYGARYYSPWLFRWTSCDPSGLVDGVNVYIYARGNPMKFFDSNGMQSQNVSNLEYGTTERLRLHSPLLERTPEVINPTPLQTNRGRASQTEHLDTPSPGNNRERPRDPSRRQQSVERPERPHLGVDISPGWTVPDSANLNIGIVHHRAEQSHQWGQYSYSWWHHPTWGPTGSVSTTGIVGGGASFSVSFFNIKSAGSWGSELAGQVGASLTFNFGLNRGLRDVNLAFVFSPLTWEIHLGQP